MPTPHEIEQQQLLLATHRATLDVLLKQQAGQGGAVFAAPGIVNGIAETRAHIRQIKTTLRGWGSAVADLPSDEPPTLLVGARRPRGLAVGMAIAAMGLVAMLLLRRPAGPAATPPAASQPAQAETAPAPSMARATAPAATPVRTSIDNTASAEVGTLAAPAGPIQRTRVVDAPGPRAGAQAAPLFRAQGTVHGAPVIADGAIYFGDQQGWLYAVDLATKQLIWSKALDSQIWASPLVTGGTVYLAGTGNIFFALDAATGTERWRLPINGAVYGSPVMLENIVFFGTNSGYIYAVNTITHQLHWPAIKLPGSIVSEPAIDGTTIFVNTRSHLYALDAASGAEQWPPFQRGAEHFTGPAIDQNRVYLGSNAGVVYALDTTSGALVQTYPFGPGVERVTAPAIFEGIVVLGSDDTLLHLIDTRTGKDTPFACEDVVRSTPVIANRVAYVMSGNHLYGVNIANSTQFLKAPIEFREDAVAPAVAEQAAYVGSPSGAVYIVE